MDSEFVAKTRVQKTNPEGKVVHKPAGAEGPTEVAEGEGGAVQEEAVEEKVEGPEEGVIPVVEHDDHDAGSSSESEIDSDEEEGLDEEEIKKAEVKKEKVGLRQNLVVLNQETMGYQHFLILNRWG